MKDLKFKDLFPELGPSQWKLLERKIMEEVIGDIEAEIWVEEHKGIKSVEAGLMFRNGLRMEQRKALEDLING